MKKRPPPIPHHESTDPWPVPAALILGALLLILALRLTMTETVRETISQKVARLDTKPEDELPFAGPAITIGFACISLFLAAAASFIAAKRHLLHPARLGRLLLIAAILTGGLISTFSAANRFASLTGLADLALALSAGWTLSLLCQSDLLGDRGRRILIAALLSILTIQVGKGLYQRLIEQPDTIEYYQQHREESLRAQGISNDPVQIKLFESRMLSREVTGFITMSNVLATAFIGLISITTALLIAKTINPRAPDGNPGLSRAPPAKTLDRGNPATGISLSLLCLIATLLLLILAFITLTFTQSKGGAAMAVLCTLTIVAGTLLWKKVLTFRRPLIAVTVTTTLLATAATLAYGLHYDSLPSKSLLFRWHYWTASADIIRSSPLTGVGLNNFGDYYTAFKRPSSPEDVKDPHNFFVRLAAEMGLPTTLLITALLLWIFFSSTRATPPHPHTVPGQPLEDPHPSILPPLIAGLPVIALWWLFHYVLAEVPNEYSILLSFLSAFLAAAGWAMGLTLADALSPRALRAVAIAALIAAAGMLIYDQVNMALITGPVAMLFWILLGLADSYPPTQSAIGNPQSAIHPVAPILLTVIALTLTFAVWIPLLNQSFPWDPAPHELRALIAERAGNNQAALQNLNQALTLTPRTSDLVTHRILLKRELHLPIADDIRQVLTLDRASARLRINLALPDSDLPPAERAAILQQALDLDQKLPPDELKRLPDDERARILQKIRELTPN